ncbi:MAG: UDP-N-acetylmuramoyl-tripeptide--D-alanyl-D-alanine ligase [Ruminococcaceae bacterium]|nr:UDP-N-acetylmuramoyl-tripeptide--D-alanyl-D-alanine ligase [Oscillospiraceae bacterium]
MKALKVSDVLKAAKGKLLSGNGDAVITDITTDSRKAANGSLFVPLSGEKFDGHDFLDEAIKTGAAAVITHKGEVPENAGDAAVICVDDTLRALGNIAEFYRSLFKVDCVAITGSVGKTTTKEMCALVLSQKYNVHKNAGNFNNEIGVPLTVFALEKEHEILISEMGMSGFGEIDRISKMVKPSVVIMTNIGMSHIEFLGSQENIFKAKSEFMKNTSEEVVVIINGDDKILLSHKCDLGDNVITVGIENKSCDIVAEDILSTGESTSFTVKTTSGPSFDVSIPAPGKHNVYNALSAIALAQVMDVPFDKVQEAFLGFIPDSMRMCVMEENDYTLINDCYNAAPDSMEAALNVLKSYDSRKVAVLGDIACLGSFSEDAHIRVGAKVCENDIDVLVTIGTEAKNIARGALENGMNKDNIYSFETIDEAISKISGIIKKGDIILIKASRVMQLERVTAFLSNK